MNVNESFIYTVLYQSLPTISWIGMVLIHVSPLLSMELHNPDFQVCFLSYNFYGAAMLNCSVYKKNFTKEINIYNCNILISSITHNCF